MNTILSYTEETGGAFLPPDVPGEAVTWDHLCEVNGRHYGVAFFSLPEQDTRIDFTVHDLAAEADVRAIVETQGRPFRLYRTERAIAYPEIGEQLDAILKAFNHLRMNGTSLPTETNEIIGRWLAVKRAHPKPTLLEGGDA